MIRMYGYSWLFPALRRTRLSNLNRCPNCLNRDIKHSDGAHNSHVSCPVCGFYASGEDIAHADYLGNTYDEPGVIEASEFIASRQVPRYPRGGLGH